MNRAHESMKPRVAITGLGVVCPIGLSVEEFGENLRHGRSGIRALSVFDGASLPSRIAGEVPWPGAVARDRKLTFALAAAQQAMTQATAGGTRPTGLGTLSLGIGLELFALEDMARLRRQPSWVPEAANERLTFLQTPSDLCAHALAHRHELAGPPRLHVSACAAGTDAIGGGYRLIVSGRSDWVLAGGADSMLHPLGVGGFCKLGALSRRNETPAAASRPFDRGRDGFVLGEGAGMLVLEPLENARRRGATILAEVCGYGNSFDALGISEPHPEGRGAVQSMERALTDAGLRPEQVDAINAHGTGTPKNDPVETLALKRVFGQHARRMPISATKSLMGHLISAAGAVEAIAAILGLRGGWVHPTLNLDDPDPACDLDYVPHQARASDAAVVLSNSFAFGGQNASIVLRRAEDA